MILTPITLREANSFIEAYHRHHDPVPGCLFCVAVSNDDQICGVAVVGRPVSRMLDDGWTAEVVRVCTDGTKNACSMLYAATWRATRAIGYKQLITYTLPEENGASLRAAGWRCLGKTGGGSWSRTKRPRVDTHPLQQKLKWQMLA